MCRLRYDERTRAYRDRLQATAKTTKEAIRITKRAIARNVYQAIPPPNTTLDIQRSIPGVTGRG